MIDRRWILGMLVSACFVAGAHWWQTSRNDVQRREAIANSRYQLPAGLQATPEQTQQLKNLEVSFEPVISGLQARINNLQTQIREAQKTGAPQIGAMIQQMGMFQREMQSAESQVQQQIMSILTDEQKAQLQSFSQP